MNNKFCISGYYGFDNFGDETILKVLTEQLKNFKNCSEITVFSSNPLKTEEQYKVKSVYSFDLLSVTKELLKCNYLISGGGSLLQDATSNKSLIYYLLVITVALFFKKKVIIFAQGIGPINNKILANITKILLKKAKYITVRDNKSMNLLSKWGIKANICNDPVWNIKINKKEKTDKIGIQLRNFHSLKPEFINDLAFCINKFYQDKEIVIFSFQNKIDLEVCNKLKEQIQRINPKINVKVIENTSNEKIIDDISELDSLIAMRYHACLIGIKAGVKVLPINYDIKVETLSKDFNLNNLDLNCSSENMEYIFADFKNLSNKYKTEQIEKLKFNFVELEENL